MARLKVKAVLLGVLTDLGASVVLGVAAGMIGGAILVAKGTPPSAIAKGLASDQTFLLLGFVMGLLAEVAGGFVAGRVARADYGMHGVAVGIVGVAGSWLLSSSAYPLWFHVGSYVLVVPAAVVGALLARPRSPLPNASQSGA
jgi:hypothetical protein